MNELETNFLKSIQEKNYQDSVDCFEELFDELLYTTGKNERAMKAYMTSLNGIIYFICRSECDKDSCFRLRNKISELFESCTNHSELKNCSLDMINYYLDACNEDQIETSNATVNSAIMYMKRNLNKQITLGKVADNVHISKSYLSSLLAKYANKSFPELLTQMRIDYAKQLLAESNHSILDISYRCGFNSQSYFCSTFKKIEGCTPTDYRESTT